MSTLCIIGIMATIKDGMLMGAVGRLSLGSQLLQLEYHTTWVGCIAGKDLLKHVVGLFSGCFVEQWQLSFGIKHWAIHFIDSTNMPIEF